MTIESNAPESAIQFVQLEGIEDRPPNITINNPNDGATIPVDGIYLNATVEDFEDIETTLTVDWYSSVEGFVASNCRCRWSFQCPIQTRFRLKSLPSTGL